MKIILNRIFSFLPSTLRQLQEENELTLQDNDENYNFPELKISAAIEEEPEKDSILNFKTPQLTTFEETSKKAIYATCVKVSHYSSLKKVKESKWTDIFGPESSPKGCWRSLYKPPTEKRTADLQWRVVHWAIAINKHVAHFDPNVVKECVFCNAEETVDHVFLYCFRLRKNFQTLEDWFRKLGEVFSPANFIFGLKYVAAKKKTMSLINFIVGEAKLAIWLTRKRKIKGECSVDPELTFKALITARIRAEFAFYKITNNLMGFNGMWGIENFLCVVDEEEILIFLV